MLDFLPGAVRGVLAILCVFVNTVLCVTPLYLLALLKLLIPKPKIRKILSRAIVSLAEAWISVNNLLFRVWTNIRWDISGLEGLSPDRWYLICCNHQCGVDIAILQYVFNKRIPFMRFFIKQELIWVPLLGLAWWALDYPFVKRHSLAYLKKHPEKRNEDLEATRKACMRFGEMPVSVLNFVEGTRFTPDKQEAQESPYKHLLRPKAGGMAFVMAFMGGTFTSILDVTVIYPEGPVGLWGLFSGRVKHVVVHVEQRSIPSEFVDGDHASDPTYRARVQRWLNDVWREKDALIARFQEKGEPPLPKNDE